MSGLEIQPHSRRLSGLAVTFLSLLALGSFVVGLNHQLIGANGPSAFPAPVAPQTQSQDQIAEATPAPDMQLAAAPVAPRRAPKAAAATPDDAAPPGDAAPADAQAPPAVNASATAADPATAPPAPAPASDSTPPTA